MHGHALLQGRRARRLQTQHVLSGVDEQRRAVEAFGDQLAVEAQANVT
jgi:hypothetical protein